MELDWAWTEGLMGLDQWSALRSTCCERLQRRQAAIGPR